MVRELERKKKYDLLENNHIEMKYNQGGSNKHNWLFGAISIDSVYVMMCKLALILFVRNYNILPESSAFAQILHL